MSEAREKKYLKQLTAAVQQFLTALDAEMRLPSTPQRGSRIAKLSNALEMANDSARYFGLGVNYRTDRKRNSKPPNCAQDAQLSAELTK